MFDIETCSNVITFGLTRIFIVNDQMGQKQKKKYD